MNNNTKKAELLSALGIPAAVIFSYAAALCLLPSSGILTSLPVPAILAIITSIFCKQRNIIYISMAVMPFLNTLLLGYDMKRASVSAVIAVSSAFLALLAKRAFITVKKSENADVTGKSKAVLAVSAVLCVVVWLVCCGNPISFIMEENANKSLAEEKYPGKLEAGATFFDITCFDYLTEITFEGADPGEKYYLSTGKTDDYKGFCMAETVLDAIDVFSGKTAISKNCIKCFINKDSFVFGDSSANLVNAEFLIERTETVTGLASFRDLYDSLTVYAEESADLQYKSIIMTANGMDGKTYYAYKEYGKDAVFSDDNKELEKEIAEKFN